MSYFLAQLMPWATEGDATRAGGSLLVLGSANVDEALRGYYTKYDCSAADINPIGGINKVHATLSLLLYILLLTLPRRPIGGINKRDLKGFLAWCAAHREHMGVLRAVADAPPSAELTGAEGAQLDEEDMGMSYDELGDLGRCRKVCPSRFLSLSRESARESGWRRETRARDADSRARVLERSRHLSSSRLLLPRSSTAGRSRRSCACASSGAAARSRRRGARAARPRRRRTTRRSRRR